MKCYYDILGIERTAPQDSIKKAYYKLSLKWHPDKNPDNMAEATEVFKDIQRAYKVLSDVHERSWYDKNRERFMTMTFNNEEELYDLIHTTVYSGFGNDPNGFFSVYSYVFGILGDREREAARISGESIDKLPIFGDSDSTYHDCVNHFYSFWEGFKTKMSFHWKNKHDVDLSIPRDIRRAMEKENADERNIARKMYNKEIQSFVETVKSRDPRIKLWKEHLKDKAKENEKKAINMRHKAWERSKNKLEQTKPCKVYGEISVDELEETLKSLELEHGKLGGETASDEEDLYCIACNKYFKSLPAFSNHEKSKNHTKNLALLRRQMLQENEELFSEIMDEKKTDDEGQLAENKEENNDAERMESQEKEKLNKEEMLEKEEKLEKEEESLRNDRKEEQSDRVGSNNDDVGFECKHSDRVTVDTTLSQQRNDADEDNDDDDDNNGDSTKKCDKKRRRRPKAERNATKVQKVFSKKSSDTEDFVCEQCRCDFVTRNKLFQHLKTSGHASIKTVATADPSAAKLKSKKKK